MCRPLPFHRWAASDATGRGRPAPRTVSHGRRDFRHGASRTTGHAGTVRNILFKDLGALDQKRLPFETLADAYVQVGRPRPEPPASLIRAAARQRLDTHARGIFSSFLRDLAAGHRPQQVMVGRPPTGTATLLKELRAVVNPHVELTFAGDATASLATTFSAADMAPSWAALETRLDPREPYAVQAATQDELRTLLARALERLDRPLLVVAEPSRHLRACPVRGPDGAVTHASWWLEELLEELRIPYLAVLSRASQRLRFRRLHRPNRPEAVRFLRERLRDATPDRIQHLVDLAGCDHAEHAHAALLKGCRTQRRPSRSLLRDAAIGPLLGAFAVLSPGDDPWIALRLREAFFERIPGEAEFVPRLDGFLDELLMPALQPYLEGATG